jgi:hypothetical protein
MHRCATANQTNSRRQKRIRMWSSDFWSMWRNTPSPPPASDEDRSE